MNEPSQKGLPAQIEAAIENGDLAGARHLLERAEADFGILPELAELRQRLTEVAQISGRGELELALRRARENAGRADYASALGILQQALAKWPQDAELRELLDKTTKAALRHEAVVARNRAVVEAAERIEGLLHRGELDEAAEELHTAGVTFGKHQRLGELQEKLTALQAEARLEQTVAHTDQVRALLDGQNWRDAVEEADRLLRLDPGNADVEEMRRRARLEIEKEEARRHHEVAVGQAVQNVERLAAANEFERATRALREAEDRLGRHERFARLAQRLDESKAEAAARKRLEWTERRDKEAEALVRQAERLSLQGKYEMAIERLRAARELNADLPGLEDKTRAALTALERSRAERQKAEELAAAKAAVRARLDALLLDEAEDLLDEAEAEFDPEDPHFKALRVRLARLRESETAGTLPVGALPVATALPEGEAEAAALARQRELASAYSWKQVFLFPFRGAAFGVFWLLLGAMLGLETFHALTGFGFFAVLRALVPVAAAGLALPIVRETLQGRHLLPSRNRLVAGRRFAADLALVLGLALLAVLPLLLFLFSRGRHGLLDAFPGFAVAAFLGWGGTCFLLLAGGGIGGFGEGAAPRLAAHGRALLAGSPETFVAINATFLLIAVTLVLRAALGSYIPWLGAPLAGALEAYLLLMVPHLIGVVTRRHRVELAKIYG